MMTTELVAAYLAARSALGLARPTLELDRWTLHLLSLRYQELPTDPGPLEILLGQGDWSVETRRGHLRRLRTFYRWAVGRFECPNPAASVAPPRRRRRLPRVLTIEQVPLVLAGAVDLRDRSLVELLLDTGIRIGEAWALRPADILQETLLVEGKTGQREVPISGSVRGLLLETILPWQGAKGPLTVGGLQQMVRRCLARAGITSPKAGPHLLRHTFARLYILAGGDQFSLSTILGHTDISSTSIYVDMDLRAVISQHQKYSPMRALSRAWGLI